MVLAPWTDFVSDFMNYSRDAPIPPSPDIFRKWAGIALVGGALGRRVWTKSSMGLTFPNTYILLVAQPGVGKYIIEEVRNLWKETVEPGTQIHPFHVSPDSMTHASLVDSLAAANVSYLPKIGPPLIYHSLLIPSEEFQVLLPTYSPEYISRLNDLFGNKNEHRETRRTGKVLDTTIEKPQISILGGVTPAYLTTTFPEEAWNTGLARRIMLIYSGETILKDLFEEISWDENSRTALLSQLSSMSQLYGQCRFSNSAVALLRDWHADGGPPTPTHSKLVHYNRSRTNLHVLKLSTISAVSRTGGTVIDEVDAKRAIEWLLEAELFMPDIFRAMTGKSDMQVIEELWMMVSAAWKTGNQNPIRGELVAAFLAHRLPSNQVNPVWEMAERSGVISRVAGTTDLWIPRARQVFGRD